MRCDLLIVGGGICGLWAAWFAALAGLDVVLVDKGACGGGGSNGVLGALAPHLPDSSNEKKRFHWQALEELPDLIAALEDETGLSTGYGRLGRLMPIRVEGFAGRMQRCVAGAPDFWRGAGLDHGFERIETERFAHWLNPELAPMGLAYDHMSARVAPRLLTKALKRAISGRVKIIEGFVFDYFDEANGQVFAADGGTEIAVQNVLLAAGYETYALLEGLTGLSLGEGVKGHSALFALEAVEDLPMLYDNGVYVVSHMNGTVAVGSSSQKEWRDPHEVQTGQCDDFIQRAKALCPPLREARLLSQWAGVRPYCFARDPIVGRLAADRNLFIVSGGYKIGFGLAHRLARAVVEQIAGLECHTPLPAGYDVAPHLHIAEKRKKQTN